MARIRSNFVSGTLNLGINTTDTSITSAGLARLADVSGSDRALIALDPFGVNGEPEVVYVTLHDIGSTPTQATILRAQEGSNSRAHPSGTQWVHSPVNSDFTNIENLIAAIEANPATYLATANPITLVPDAPQLPGTATSVARSDHGHAIAAAQAGASAPGNAAAEGVATSFARSDHVHARETQAQLIGLVIPTGTLFPFAGTVLPAGFEWCDGASLLRSGAGGHAELFGVIGTTYGAADGTHFSKPDLRGRFPLGLDNLGGAVAAGRVAAATAIGNTAGAETVTITVGQLPVHHHAGPSHTHPMGDHTHTTPAHTHGSGTLATSTNTHHHQIATFFGIDVVYGGTYGFPEGYAVNTRSNQSEDTSHSHTLTGASASGGASTTGAAGALVNTGAAGTGNTGDTGTGTAVNNMPPYLAMNYIIKVGVVT